MQIRFLGKETITGDSPTLYATDRGTYIIQGWVITDPEMLAKLDLPEGETCVEIYARLLAHLAKDGLRGTLTSWTAPIVHVMDNGNLVIQGKRVTSAKIRRELTMPDNEDCVEVSRAALAALLWGDGEHGTDDPGAA
jgi:hypothetical protein